VSALEPATLPALFVARVARSPEATAMHARGADGAWAPIRWADAERAVAAMLATLRAAGVQPGDRVIYGAYAGESVKTRESDKAVDYKILDDADVIAFIK
jgi:acyl-CoA synthetase (AMP-forming)/AMP-acid ligase II